jgi:hypothetical protein
VNTLLSYERETERRPSRSRFGGSKITASAFDNLFRRDSAAMNAAARLAPITALVNSEDRRLKSSGSTSR